MSKDNERSEDPDTPEQDATDSAIVRHHWRDSGQPSVAIVEAVTAATDRTMVDLPPLSHSIDPDALDTLVTSGQSVVTVSFQYAGVRVSVNGTGTIDIRVDGEPARDDT